MRIENISTKNIIVTGGAGFIGSHIVDELVSRHGRPIVVVDNLFLGTTKNIEGHIKSGKVQLVKADVTKYRSISRVLDEHSIDVIFHLAVLPLPVSLVRPIYCFNQNIKMTQNICEYLRKKKSGFLVNYSSSEVYGTGLYTPIEEMHPSLGYTPYAASKVATDALVWSYVKTFAINALTIRPFNNYGPRQNAKKYAGIIPITTKRILNGQKPVIHGTGEQTRDYVFAKDTARITVDLASSAKFDGEAYNISTGRQISVTEVVKAICTHLQYKGEIEYIGGRKGDVDKLVGTDKKLRKLLNPQYTSFEEGIKTTVDWYKSNL